MAVVAALLASLVAPVPAARAASVPAGRVVLDPDDDYSHAQWAGTTYTELPITYVAANYCYIHPAACASFDRNRGIASAILLAGGTVAQGAYTGLGLGAAETADEIPGLSSAYKDVTTGNSIRNVATDVTPEQFGNNLTAEGWKVTTSTSGRGATIYTKDGATYSVYGQSASTGGPTAQFIPRGATSPTLKIRLGN
jgi:hypothetical protein